jgi:hypothetical protein
MISDNVRNGINVAQASQATIADITIEANGEDGVVVTENSGVNLGSETRSGLFNNP